MYKKIYFVGIKGVGMATIAIIATQAGFIVAGSDVEEEFITDSILEKEKINVLKGFSSQNILEFIRGENPKNILVISSAAHGGLSNIESETAREKGMKVITHGQAVGLFMSGELFGRKDIEGVSVCGAHGKTTISAFLSSCMSLLGIDPSFTVGTSEIFPIGPAGHFGKGQYFVAEADEYLSDLTFDRNPKFLYQNPTFLIINNIDFDHPDFYKNIEEIELAFTNFLNNIKPNGFLIINGDDDRVLKIAKDARKDIKVITYGVSEKNMLVISSFEQVEFAGRFSVSSSKTHLGRFEISIPGFHNAKNSLAVIAFLLEIGVSVKKIQEVLPKFTGTKRRIEKIGTTKGGAIVIDDYAHHPIEIKKTLQAIKYANQNKKIICIFQPHTYSRTNALLSDFVSAFGDCDNLLFLPTFSSAREKDENDDLQRKKIESEFIKIGKSITLLDNNSVVEYVSKNFPTDGFVIVVMGAGDVYKIGYELVK